MRTPCEFFIWYLIPTIRREIVNLLAQEFSLSQNEIVNLLGLTKSAVSQYMHEKREMVRKRNRNFTLKKICTICKIVRRDGFICSLHKRFGKEFENFKLCMR